MCPELSSSCAYLLTYLMFCDSLHLFMCLHDLDGLYDAFILWILESTCMFIVYSRLLNLGQFFSGYIDITSFRSYHYESVQTILHFHHFHHFFDRDDAA